MGNLVISYDLGTGGLKTSLFDIQAKSLGKTFSSYETFYPFKNHHEQKPLDWWNSIIKSTKKILQDTNTDADSIEACSISGHSLGVVPLDRSGNLLREYVPIWSDSRAAIQAEKYFEKFDYKQWYMKTGNGFPRECYPLFKIMWYRENEPELYKNIFKILGTKDFCNFKLTGRMRTDYSYASGSGVFDLVKSSYDEEFIEGAEISRDIFPEIIHSHDIVGNLTEEASNLTGLPKKVKVICGGVDNSCMALGARCYKQGRTYVSLGSSSWIAVSSDSPVLDFKHKPYVFSHVVEGMFASATCIFSAGNSLRWVRDNLFRDFYEIEKQGLFDSYALMDLLAAKAPVGSNKLIFNPSLAGGSMIEESAYITGGFIGLSLLHNRSDIIRSAMEGIALNLKHALEILRLYQKIDNNILFVGGGSKSSLWRKIFANVFESSIVKTNIDQDAASLGAAAIAFKGTGLWKNYDIIENIHEIESIEKPNKKIAAKYNQIYEVYKKISHFMAESGVMLEALDLED